MASGYGFHHAEVSAGQEGIDNYNSPEDKLLALFKNCWKPPELLASLQGVLKEGVNVNSCVGGNTALGLAILHVNRGLRFHRFPVPELKRLEDLHSPKSVIEAKCIEVDSSYQELVYQCLELLLSRGANPKIIPTSCPAIPHCSEWNESFEHKIMQSEHRWNLLGFGTSMEFSTYNIFNPLTNYKVENTSALCLFHLAAWRGDARCLQLLLKHGVNVNAGTRDGRNALHLLYLYCNKPSDLVTSTSVLVDTGIDVNTTDSAGMSPIMVLLYHIITKRTHVKYLANSYTSDYLVGGPEDDNFHEEIKQCIMILLKAGANVNHKNVMGETPLHIIYKRFEHSLEGCEAEFQTRGHYLVPYQFKVLPLVEFSHFLLENGAEVNSKTWYEKSPLHHLSLSIRNLSLDETLNPKDDILQCYRVLVSHGAQVNAKDCSKATVLHILIKTITHHRHSFERYEPVIELLLSHHLNVNVQDKGGNTSLHHLLGSFNSNSRAAELIPLLLLLLRGGGDPSIPNVSFQYPLNNLIKQHVYHHDPLQSGGVSANLKDYLRLMDMVCQTMSLDALNHVITVYRSSGFCGLVCEEKCDVYTLLVSHFSSPRSLKLTCQYTIWKSMARQFYLGWDKLPLPTELKRYLYNIGTGC